MTEAVEQHFDQTSRTIEFTGAERTLKESTSSQDQTVSKATNHHYVPQFYFRQFSGGANCIQVFVPRTRLVCKNAPIKHQCAKSNFHGDEEAEQQIGKLETIHATVLKTMISAAWNSNPLLAISSETLALLTEAVNVLRHRTLTKAKMATTMSSEIMFESFKSYCEANMNADEYRDFLVAKERGEFDIEMNETAAVLQNISLAILMAKLISDLDFCLVRNRTDIPFIFCDAPVVFHNTFCRNVTHRGVLGLTTPGLQIFLPLNSDVLLMLYDSNVYQCNYSGSAQVDVTTKFEISQLNALQMLAHDNAVYFSNYQDAEYVQNLWSTHSTHRVKQQRYLVTHDDWLLDGKPVKGLLHQFERLHDINLDLSFVKCEPIQESEYRPRRRDPELAKAVNEMVDRLYADVMKERSNDNLH